MRENRIMTVVLLAAAGVCGLTWVFLPTLQGGKSAVEGEVSVHLERARRLLHQFSADLPYHAVLLDQLRQDGVEPEEPETLAEDEGLADDYQQEHAALWESFQPTDWTDRPTNPKASYGAIARLVRDGLSGRDHLLDENQQLLRDAMTEVDAALAVESGGASGREVAEAVRLKGVIQYFTGMTDRIRAAVTRADADPLRARLNSLGDQASSLASQQALVAGSGIADQIEQLRKLTAEAEAAVKQEQAKLTELDARIADARRRIQTAETQRNEARARMGRLGEEGIDFSRSDGAKAFEEAYLAADRAYRAADRDVQFLTAGSFPNAEIDASGDFLTGRYLEKGSPFNLTIEPGLLRYQADREVLTRVIADRQREVEELRAGTARLETLRSAYAQTEQDAKPRLADVRSRAEKDFAELNRVESEAFALEETALAQLDRSAKTLKDAATRSADWIRDAQGKTQSLSPESQGRSAFQVRTDDAWIGGFIQAQSADARLAKAWIFYDRFIAHSQTAALLERVRDSLALSEADVDNEKAKAAEARTAGSEEVKLAVSDLERSHKDVDRHWTLVAQAAGTTYLLALFGDPSYIADTVEGYRKAVQTREEEKFVQPLLARLRQLEQR